MAYSSNDPRNYLAIAKQSAKGTEASAGFKFPKYLSGGLKPAIDSETTYEGGDGQDPGLVYKQKVKTDGEFDVYARPDTFLYLSAWAMGSGVNPPASTNGIASHIYTPNATVPYLTVEDAFGGGNTIDRVTDAIVTGLTIEGEAGMPWKLTVPLVGGGTPYFRDGAASALTATLESGDPAMYAGGAVLIDGATSLDVTKFSYKFERKVDDDLFTNQIHRREVVPLARNLTIDQTVIMQNASVYNQILYGGGSQVPVTLATGAFHAERQLSGSQLLAIDIPNVRYTAVEVNRLEPDGQTVVLDISGQAVKAGTGITQLRGNVAGVPTSYLL